MSDQVDVIVIGGGHNGLVAAAYLGGAGLKVRVLERRDRLGGPVGRFEFMPGYSTSFTNSPGSLDPTVVDELDLPGHGLRFVQPDPSVLHPFAGTTLVGWRDRTLVDYQIEQFAAGEAARYHGLIATLERLGRRLGASLLKPPPSIGELLAGVTDLEDQHTLGRVMFGSLQDLLDEHLRSEPAKALMAMLAVNAQLLPPSVPGSAIGLMLRPLSLASGRPAASFDPRNAPLRGSVGLPIGSMSAIVDALEAACLASGVDIRRETPAVAVLRDGDVVRGVVADGGDEHRAATVISAISPTLLFSQLLDEGVDDPASNAMRSTRVRGSAFKIVLGLDRLPDVRGLPEGLKPEHALRGQFRIGPSLSYIESAIVDGMAGRPSQNPIMWGLVPSLTSPGLAPPDRHLMSINVWHAPRDLSTRTWAEERDRFGARCLDVLEESFPGLRSAVVEHRFLGPDEIESELGMVGSNITHGDMHPGRMFGFRPDTRFSSYRGPLRGLYLTGAGTWPGGYVTGLPGHNTSRVVLADLARTGPVHVVAEQSSS